MSLAASLTSGCSGETGPKCYPVRGVVYFNNAPLPETMIIFHPLDAGTTTFPNPVGYTDKDGNFELTTNRPNDGAPAGHYAMTVEYRDLQPDGDELTHDGPNLLPEKYARPDSSGLQFEVEPRDNEVPRIDIEAESAAEY